MALTSLLVQGVYPADEVVDETGLKISEMDIEAKRTYVEKKDGGTRMVASIRGENPMLAFTFTGEPIRTAGALVGLAIVHPGTANIFANIPASSTINGFVLPSSVQVIVKDVKTKKSDTAEDKITIPCEFWPGITTYSSATS